MPIPRQQNIVGYWKGNLDENGLLHDFSSGANHGTLVSAPPQIKTPYGSALDYDGSADYIELNDNHDFTADYTISSVVKVNVGTGGTRGIFSKAVNLNTDGEYQLIITSGGVLSLEFNGGNLADPSSFSEGEWKVVTITRGTVSVLYIDGKIVSTTSSSIPVANTTYKARIGAARNTAGLFPGIIAHTIIWNIALNPNEVLDNYNEMERLKARK